MGLQATEQPGDEPLLTPTGVGVGTTAHLTPNPGTVHQGEPQSGKAQTAGTEAAQVCVMVHSVGPDGRTGPTQQGLADQAMQIGSRQIPADAAEINQLMGAASLLCNPTHVLPVQIVVRQHKRF